MNAKSYLLKSYLLQHLSSLLCRIQNDGQRTAGDVLNDIGSMLADLTDELDAMLHMERDPAATNMAWKKKDLQTNEQKRKQTH